MKKIALICKIIDKCDFICETGNNFILILGGLADIHHEKQKTQFDIFKDYIILGDIYACGFFSIRIVSMCVVE